MKQMSLTSLRNQLFKVYSLNKASMMCAYAGLVINTPIVNPMIDVIANPLNNPAPALNNGSIAASVVK